MKNAVYYKYCKIIYKFLKVRIKLTVSLIC